MRLFFALVLMSAQFAFSTSALVYPNDAKDLKHYISHDDFNSFYDTLLCLDGQDLERFLAMSHRGHVLQDFEFPLVEFYVRSPEITPAIPGYTAVYVEGSDAGNADGVGLVAYVPDAAHVRAEAQVPHHKNCRPRVIVSDNEIRQPQSEAKSEPFRRELLLVGLAILAIDIGLLRELLEQFPGRLL